MEDSRHGKIPARKLLSNLCRLHTKLNCGTVLTDTKFLKGEFAMASILEFLFRKKPQYRLGAIITTVINNQERFVVIRNIRWIRPYGDLPPSVPPKWQWVYDGFVLNVMNNTISYATGIFTIPEGTIIPTPGLS